MTDLKPCPFCGGKAESDEAECGPDAFEEGGIPWGHAAYAGCEACGLYFHGDTEAYCIAAWNRRLP